MTANPEVSHPSTIESTQILDRQAFSSKQNSASGFSLSPQLRSRLERPALRSARKPILHKITGPRRILTP